MAETKKDAVTAFDAFIETYQVKYQRAADCLVKDRDALLAFYDFPAEHWKHLRTTNPIESTFATVRHHPVKGLPVEQDRPRHGFYEGAQKSWRRIDGHNQLPKLIQGVKFADGIEEVIGNSAVPQTQAAA
jgi:putative transposase